jgi:cell division protein FtsX
LWLLQLWLEIVILIFIVSIAIIIYSVIWNFIYYYRDEIYITKLVWGSNTFIYGPFVLQWMIYSLVAFLLNVVIFVLLIKNLNIIFWDLYTLSISVALLILEVLVFLLIWWISWYFSSKKYLKMKM